LKTVRSDKAARAKKTHTKNAKSKKQKKYGTNCKQAKSKRTKISENIHTSDDIRYPEHILENLEICCCKN